MKTTVTDWQRLAFDSYYNTITTLQERLAAGDTKDVAEGLEQFRIMVVNEETHELRRTLTLLMEDVLLWLQDAQYRTVERAIRIDELRDTIADLQADNPTLTDDRLNTLWPKALEFAKRNAQATLNFQLGTARLTTQSVFKTDYQPQ